MIPAPRKGFAVAIRRKDGTEFLCCAGQGNTPPVWAACNRKYAVAHKRFLIAEGFKARVVPVIYFLPIRTDLVR
jgi:hypothetical protein